MLGIWVTPRVKEKLQRLAYSNERKLSAYCAEVLVQHAKTEEQ